MSSRLEQSSSSAAAASEVVSPRKRIRHTEAALCSPNHGSVNKWESPVSSWPPSGVVTVVPAAGAVSPHSHCNGSSSDSISLSGSGSESGSRKASPVPPETTSSGGHRHATPSLNLSMHMPKISTISAAAAVSNIAASTSLNTPPVLPSDLRPLLFRPSASSLTSVVDDQSAAAAGPSTLSSPVVAVVTSSSATSAAAGVAGLAAWQISDFDGIASAFDGSLSGLSDLTSSAYPNDIMEFVKRQSSINASCGASGSSSAAENYFQYILMASTSSAVRLQEEPLTYLNQGQSYEIKCKKLNVVEPGVQNRLYRSVVRVGFHDRRQKFQERELLQQWKHLHPTDRIIDADLPMSYNVFNVKIDSSCSHIDFVWDCTKNTSIFIKVNCISTEFTVHKHGGEKGVPFRLQVDTYGFNEGAQSAESKHLHSAYAQIKVFKTKGADRKNKTDRERAEKRADKEKYQPSYDYTILTETFPTDAYEFETTQQNNQHGSQGGSGSNHGNHSQAGLTSSSSHHHNNPGSTNGNGSLHNDNDSRVSSQAGTSSPSPSSDDYHDALLAESTPIETVEWLRRQRFIQYVKMFSSFSGTDLLRLNRDDLIQICGVADGIRLYNALQYKRLQPKLTLYMCVPGAPAYHAVFLKALTLAELVKKVCNLIQVQANQIYDVYCQGPDGINVHVNDEVVQNMPDRSRFLIDAMKCGEESECYRILLKSAGETPSS